jgi:hypothetical protein
MARAGEGTVAAASLRASYKAYFELQKIEEENIGACNDIAALVQPFYENQPTEKAKTMNTEQGEACHLFGEKMAGAQRVIVANTLTATCSLPASLIDFKEKHWYFLTADKHFDGQKLQELMDCVSRFANWIYETSFVGQKELLKMQLQLVPVGQHAIAMA